MPTTNRNCFMDQNIYQKAHWWAGYDEQPGAEYMFCSVCSGGQSCAPNVDQGSFKGLEEVY